MLSDTEFVRKHWTDNGKGLRKRHQMFLCGVRVAGISCLNSNDGLFCWVDLRHLLQSRNQEGAIRLWKIILEEFGSNVSPGSSWHCSDPGWFSFCFSYMSDQTVQESLNQIQLSMERRRSNPIYDKERACQKMTAKKKKKRKYFYLLPEYLHNFLCYFWGPHILKWNVFMFPLFRGTEYILLLATFLLAFSSPLFHELVLNW